MVVGCWLYLFVVLGLWGLLHEADLWWPATLLMFSPRWVLTLPGIFLLPAAAALRRRMLGVLLVTLMLIVGPIMNFRLSSRLLSSDLPAGLRLRVMTCNLHYRKPDEASLKRLLAETRPDIVAIQEWPISDQSALFATSEWYVHITPSLFLASRFPLRQAAELGRNSMNEGAVGRYELETTAGAVTLFSLHLASPRQGLYESIHDPRTGIANLAAGSELRWQQSENLADDAEQVEGPVLLAGDFNTPPESVIFRRVWGRYTDAFSSAGWGWGYTFIGGRTAVRIDHILAGPGWRCQRCWVGPNIGSPHRPVVADLIWATAAEDR